MRRMVDVLAAGTLLAVSAPLLGLAALLVRLEMGRPVLFRQLRSGLHGREFKIIKFRTMRTETYPGEPDPDRLTRLGRLMRSISLDELPQLMNVLRGEMSLIGPRPTLPEQVVHYDARQRGRLSARPGITGWAQVHGRNRLSWPERIELDLWYLDHRSIWLDLKILGLTIVQLMRPHGVTADGGINPGFPVPPVPDADTTSHC